MTVLSWFLVNCGDWMKTHPILSVVVVVYLIGLVVVSAGDAKRDGASIGGYIAVGALGVVVIAVFKWAIPSVFA